MSWPASGFVPVCPACRQPLESVSGARMRCPGDDVEVQCVGGVWRFLTPPRAEDERHFVDDYLRLRRDEGWGSDDAGYYRALPYRDTSGRYEEVWRIRAASYELLLRRILAGGRLRIVDLGAGNCWLSWRLAQRGHLCAAVDLSDDDQDGLGAADRYAGADDFLRLQASFDQVPLADGSLDLVIFNGSLHYSTDLLCSLTEAKRLLGTGGRIVIMDSPVYLLERSGERMLRERSRQWHRHYGSGFGCHPGAGFLTRRRLRRLGQALGLHWTRWPLPLGWHWRLSPFVSLGLGRREPARFPLILGHSIKARTRSTA